ncbi:MAG: deoxyuridine 5'-triphosphate nucleotidohydrolase [Clostridia bacterium]|nr:deoxyuridine 5'-triphosphate nucleotidohydrolase [Clostridia bacterium]
MNKIALFEKVSEEEFIKSGGKNYDKIVLPKRATEGSAGYDFFSSYDIEIEPLSDYLVPTGIRAKIENGWVLCLFPRSGLGFKYGLSLKNTIGVIDADYYYSDNEGHIMIKLHNNSTENVFIPFGKAFAQGIFFPFGITEDDNVSEKRKGGFGSTDS